MPATSTRYFLTYNKNDRAWAEWIAAQLENAGHTAIYQHRDFPPGCNFEAEIHNALKTTDRTQALLSRTYLDPTSPPRNGPPSSPRTPSANSAASSP